MSDAFPSEDIAEEKLIKRRNKDPALHAGEKITKENFLNPFEKSEKEIYSFAIDFFNDLPPIRMRGHKYENSVHSGP